MNLNDIAQLRLHNQQLAQTKFKHIEKLVGWMGALQAQDFNMMKWAIGIRLPNMTEQIVDDAVANGKIIRTHLLRPTWHVVSATDVHWILELTAPHIKSTMRSRHKHLELTDDVIIACKSAIENWLRDGHHLTRKEIVQKLLTAKLVHSNEQVTHIMAICELDRLVCSGRLKDKNPTYALLEERVPNPPSISRDEALTRLAGQYFGSHSPATLQDFIWWSGLPVKDARKALESVKSELSVFKIEDQEFWMPPEILENPVKQQIVHLLPAYDEFIISYKDRSASLIGENHRKAISANGLFYPVVLINGKVTGTWKRIQDKERMSIEINYFGESKLHDKSVLEDPAARYGRFLNRNVEVANPSGEN